MSELHGHSTMVDRLSNEQLEMLMAVPLLRDLVDIALYATGADLAKSGAVEVRTEAAVEPIAATVQTVTLLAPNGRRKGALIYNDSPATLYVKFGKGASSTDWSVKLNQDDQVAIDASYRGRVTGVFSAAGAGQARVTEYAW